MARKVYTPEYRADAVKLVVQDRQTVSHRLTCHRTVPVHMLRGVLLFDWVP